MTYPPITDHLYDRMREERDKASRLEKENIALRVQCEAHARQIQHLHDVLTPPFYPTTPMGGDLEAARVGG